MPNADSTFRTHRVLPYSPAEVYAAFASPVLLARWWGPTGFTNEFQVFEFHEGGRWQCVMVGPDGKRHPNLNRFGRLQPAAQVVVRHESAPHFTLTVDLERVPEGTRLTWTQAFDDAEVAAAVKPIVVPANEQNLDRLTAVLGAA